MNKRNSDANPGPASNAPIGFMPHGFAPIGLALVRLGAFHNQHASIARIFVFYKPIKSRFFVPDTEESEEIDGEFEIDAQLRHTQVTLKKHPVQEK